MSEQNHTHTHVIVNSFVCGVAWVCECVYQSQCVLCAVQGTVFVGSSEGVASVPVSNCSHYWSCAECVLARDPFCAWDFTQRVCAHVSSIKHQP